MSSIADLFNITNTYTPNVSENEYHTSHINILAETLKRKTNIEQSRIWDYIAVENDPFFSKRNETTANKITRSLSRLSVLQQSLVATSNQLYLARFYNFVPKNVLSFIRNYTATADTLFGILPTVSQGIPLKYLEKALLSDLLSYFDNGQLTYNNIIDMYAAVVNNQDVFSQIKTGNLKSILSLPLMNFLPDSFSVILESLTYLDLLDEVFTDDTTKNNFNLAILNALESKQDTKINTFIDSSYETYSITYSDPLGLNRQEEITASINNGYFNLIEPTLESVYSQYNVPTSYREQLTESLQLSLNETLLSDVLDSGILLPDTSDCVRVISNKATVDTNEAIQNSFILFQKEIISRIPEIDPSGANSFDYLLNIKRHLEVRDNLVNSGSSLDSLRPSQQFIRSVLSSNLTDSQIDDLYIKLKTVLKV